MVRRLNGRPPTTRMSAPPVNKPISAAEQVLKEWRKAAKHDSAVRMAAAVTEGGKEGVQAAYEATQQFHDAWRLKARDVLARSEWHRRKQMKRVRRWGRAWPLLVRPVCHALAPCLG
jgi:hypothetical protein